MHFVSRRLLLPALCAFVGACTDTRGEDAGAVIDSREGSLALLQLERFTDSEVPLPRLVAGAKIARYRAIDGDALLRLLGADARDLDTCSASGGLGELDLGAEAQVELLSVGDITLRGGGAQSTLSPRLFPALATTASGWFYAGEAEATLPRAELDEYVLSAPGESGTGAFEVAVAAPGPVLGLSLAGLALEQTASLDRAAGVELTWDAEDAGDRIELELYTGGSLLACTVRDDGHFALTQAQLSALETDENASLVVRRVRVAPVDMHGITSAYARVASSRTLALQVR
ncbi:MAG: hypothetical protein QM778_33030 [Myxococcales bacterium]